MSGRRVPVAIWSLVNDMNLQLEVARFLNESLPMPFLTYGSETTIWRENERSRIIVVHMDNLRGFLGIRRMDKVPDALIRELCRVKEGVDEKIDEGVFR